MSYEQKLRCCMGCGKSQHEVKVLVVVYESNVCNECAEEIAAICHNFSIEPLPLPWGTQAQALPVDGVSA